jgi:hypothetical protein
MKNTIKNFETYFMEGVHLLEEFSLNQKEETLKKASGSFFEALKLKRDDAETNFYLSYIFYLFGKDQLASEYFNISHSLNPLNPQLKELQGLLSRK